ncbi:MAG: hypothetical protein P8P30_03760 [Rickettsiales bacterium]|nr:hypothetical protein [Rickettsiales bacterium]
MFFSGFLSILLLFSTAAYGGAWTVTPRKWEIYQDIITYYSTDHYYDTHGQRVDQPRYTKLESGTRFEYGYRDGLTLGAATQLTAVHSTATNLPSRITGVNCGLADPKLYARKRLWQDAGSVLSAQAQLKLPSLFGGDTLARSGSDEFSGEARFLGGHNFTWLGISHFSNLEAAYEWRPKNTADLIHLDAAVGFKLHDRLTLLPQIFSTWKASGSDRNFTQSGDDAYDLVKGQLSFVTPLSGKLSLQIAGFHHLYGRNTGGGSGGTISLWRK